MSILQASNVIKEFAEGRESVRVLKGISFEVERGEIVALEGPSGSGKTTLLSILGCILTPTRGEVVIDGVRAGEDSLNVKGVRGREARTEAERVIDAVGLGDRKNFLPRDLSGGQKQRVAIARALAGNAPILLADEPTANLDSVVGAQVLSMFRDLAKQENRALVIVTHDPKVRSI